MLRVIPPQRRTGAVGERGARLAMSGLYREPGTRPDGAPGKPPITGPVVSADSRETSSGGVNTVVRIAFVSDTERTRTDVHRGRGGGGGHQRQRRRD